MPEEHIIRTYRLPSHVIFNLLQEIKDDLKPSTRSHAIPGLGLQKLGKFPVNFRNIPEILKIFQDFLESSGNFWKVSGNLPQIFHPFATLNRSIKTSCNPSLFVKKKKPPVLLNILWLLYSLFANTLICVALGRLHWSICK